jgi:hypothetical protein
MTEKYAKYGLAGANLRVISDQSSYRRSDKTATPFPYETGLPGVSPSISDSFPPPLVVGFRSFHDILPFNRLGPPTPAPT